MLSYRSKRWVERNVWHRLRQFSSVVHPLPPVAGALAAVLLATSGQMHEIYLVTWEAAADGRGRLAVGAAVAMLTLLSAALLLSSHTLGTTRLDVVYSQHESPSIDRGLRALRDGMGMLAAALPWLGLAYGLRRVAVDAGQHADKLACALGQPCLHAEPRVVQLAASSQGLASALVMCAAVAVPLLVVVYRCREHRWLQWGTAVLVLATVLGLVVLPAAATLVENGQTRLIEVYRGIGSLGMTAAILVAIYALVAALSLLSSKVGLPIIPLTLAVYVAALIWKLPLDTVALACAAVMGIIIVLGIVSRQLALASLAVVVAAASVMIARQAVSSDPPAPPTLAAPVEPQTRSADPATAFRSWLAARADRVRAHYEATQRRYPVFIVAAQGGGIYAAAAASQFLSVIEDERAGFIGHVFAVSAVSGGAIGASVVHSLLAGEAAPARSSRCGAGTSLVACTSRVIGDDHLAGLLGFTLSDYFGLFPDRARGLALSFVTSEREAAGSSRLERHFAKHWTVQEPAPALVLNATSTETGYSVAYSPFGLGGRRDGTVFAFGDSSLGLESAAGVTVIDAAVTSARFPGVLPAMTLKSGPPEAPKRLNFVDGGYADGSGATVALELYAAIQELAKAAEPTNPGTATADGMIDLLKLVDLRLVLLTSAVGRVDIERAQGGYGRDSIAPIETLLNVRDRLTEKAIKRALTEIGEGDVEARKGRADGWKVVTVELDQESFRLALGWTLSRSTAGLVAAMLGAPGQCADDRQDPDHVDGPAKAGGFAVTRRRFRDNSCIQKAILGLLPG